VGGKVYNFYCQGCYWGWGWRCEDSARASWLQRRPRPGIWAVLSRVGWEEPGEGKTCLGLAAAGQLADGLLSGPPQGQLYAFLL
jgi:hypothetical protein